MDEHRIQLPPPEPPYWTTLGMLLVTAFIGAVLWAAWMAKP